MNPLPLVLAAVTFSGCNLHFTHDQVKGTGAVTSEARTVAPQFHAIAFHAGINGEVKRGPLKVTVYAQKEVLPYVETTVHDGQLEIDFKDNVDIHSEQDVVVQVTAPSFDEVDVSGGGAVELMPGQVEKLALGSSGGARLKVTGLEAQELELDASGGSDIRLAGKAQRVKAQISGGGTLNATELPVDQLAVEASGGSEVDARVKDQLSGDLTGGSTLRVKGRPALKDFDMSGGSEITTD